MQLFLRKYFIFILLLGIFLLILIFLLINQPPKPATKPLPGKTPIPSQALEGPEPGGDYVIFTTPTPAEAQKNQALLGIIRLQYYEGEYFIFDYFPTGNYTRVTFFKDYLDEGEKEFTDFLTKYGIKNKNWLPNLRIDKI